MSDGYEDEHGCPRPWVHEATITDPSGLRVQVTVTIPPAGDWGQSLEALEIAQMQAAAAARHLRASRTEYQERAPF